MSCTDTDTSLTVLFYSPSLQTSKQYVVCLLLFSLTCCIKSHTVETKKKNHNKMTKKIKKKTRTACKYIFICFVIFISFAVLCKLNPMTSLFCDLLLWVVFHSCSKLQAYFDEATLLLYFAQSVLVKKKKKKEERKRKRKKTMMMIIISTNPVTAEPRRKINNGKEEHLCWAEPQQRIYTRLRSSSSEKYSYNERKERHIWTW